MFRIRNGLIAFPSLLDRQAIRQPLARRHRIGRLGIAAAALAALAAGRPARADLQIDTSFGINGMAYTAFGSDNSDTPNDLLLQPDGMILTAGISINSSTQEFFIAMTRHSAEGVPDTAGFGVGGKVFKHFVLRDQANAVALQGNGKIVAAGMSANSNAVAAQVPSVYRFNSNGSVDSTFNGIGAVAARYDGVSSGEHGAVTVLPDGRVLAIGRSHSNINGGQPGFGMQRYSTGGASDLSQRINTTFNFNSRGSGAFYPDGRILWVNTGLTGGVFQWVLARSDSSGNVDPTFGVRGTGVPAPNSAAPPRARILADGRILVAGTSATSGGSQQFTVIRLKSNGTIDSTFGTNGRTNITFAALAFDECRDIALYLDGRILLAGRANTNGGQPGLIRLLPNGAPDSSFSGNGMLTLNLNGLGGTHYFTKIIILPDLRVLAAGFDFSSHRGDFFLTRLSGEVSGVPTHETPPLPALLQVYPNPSRGMAALRVDIAHPDAATVKIFDAAGRLVRTVFSGELSAGSHDFSWDGVSDAGATAVPGIYLARVAAGGRMETRKLVRVH